jgi:hypothetical protein
MRRHKENITAAATGIHPAWGLAGLVLVALMGCLSIVKPMGDETASQWIPFIRDGTTTLEEVRNRMGEPSDTYEDGRVLIYWMCEEGKRLRSGKDCKTGHTFNLVLVFEADGVLERHSLVEKH